MTSDGLRPLLIWLTDPASAYTPSAIAFFCSPSLFFEVMPQSYLGGKANQGCSFFSTDLSRYELKISQMIYCIQVLVASQVVGVYESLQARSLSGSSQNIRHSLVSAMAFKDVLRH